MLVQLNRASLVAVHTSVHYIFISRSVTLIFPVIESKHLKLMEEGCFDCKDAELCQAVLQKSRPVGHRANLSRKEVCLTSAKHSPPRAQAMLREALKEEASS